MAKYEIKFFDDLKNDDFIKVEHIGSNIVIEGIDCNKDFTIVLDKSTAIKFAKTLRTEINKINESEVGNG